MARPGSTACCCEITALPQEHVSCSAVFSASGEQVWSLVRDFHGTWHPAISTMASEQDDAGRVIRAFTVNGDDATYRERLTWFSDSDWSFAYTHLEGIAGVQSYQARLSVQSTSESECNVTLSAQLTAPEPRATEIAAGTQIVFNDALSAIKTLLQSSLSEIDHSAPEEIDTMPTTISISGSPTLGVSYIDGPRTDTVCLFLHGIGGNKSNWHKQLRVIARYCTAVAMDLRGYGDSELGENQSTVEDYCEDILRVANPSTWLGCCYREVAPACLKQTLMSVRLFDSVGKCQ